VASNPNSTGAAGSGTGVYSKPPRMPKTFPSHAISANLRANRPDDGRRREEAARGEGCGGAARQPLTASLASPPWRARAARRGWRPLRPARSAAAATGGGGRRRDPARRPPRSRRPAGPPAGLYGPHHPRRPGPTPGRRRPWRGPPSSRCWPTRTWPAQWSPPTRCRPTLTPPSSWSPASRPTTCFCVKANQPTLLARCARLPWHYVPVLDRTRDRGHGRVQLRTLKAVTVHHVGFPHTAQVLQVTRKTRDLRDGNIRRWRTVVVYAVTSLAFAQASPAARTLGDRERPARRAGCDLRRGRLPGPDRDRPAGHGLPAQPDHRGAQPGRGRSTSPPRCAATPATPPTLATLGISLG
jgi:hypothetical protein